MEATSGGNQILAIVTDHILRHESSIIVQENNIRNLKSGKRRKGNKIRTSEYSEYLQNLRACRRDLKALRYELKIFRRTRKSLMR